MTYDDRDYRLINALGNDGRASLRSLADELDVSVTTVSNRLDALEDGGVITGFSPDIDYNELGYDVTAILQLKVEGGAISEVSAELETAEQMVSVYEVTGDFDIIAIGKYRDTDDMNDQIKSLLGHPAIIETNTSIVLNVIGENEQLTLPTEG